MLAIGWREWLSLPELGIASIKAKVDTGARSSALHVDWLEEAVEDGIAMVRFGLTTGRRRGEVRCQAPIFDRRPVTDSGGHTGERVFIRTELAVPGLSWPIEINLTSRTHMLFPMLLGRTAMAGQFLVDPARSYLLGPRPTAVVRPSSSHPSTPS